MKQGQFFFIIILLIMGCSDQKQTTASHQTLYQAIGGAPQVEKIVDAFIINIANDSQVIRYFRQANVDHFRQGFILHFCQAIDGPCTFEGDSMQDIHTGMNISEGDFNRVVELLIKALEQTNVSYPLQNRILNNLAPLRGEIIKI